MPKGNLRVHWGQRAMAATLCGKSPRTRRLSLERDKVDCPTCLGLLMGSLAWLDCDACGRAVVGPTGPGAAARACTCGRGHHVVRCFIDIRKPATAEVRHG